MNINRRTVISSMSAVAAVASLDSPSIRSSLPERLVRKSTGVSISAEI